MQFLDAARLEALLDYPLLADALKADFAAGAMTSPVRTAHVMQQDDAGSDSLLMMPAWDGQGDLGVKLVTVRMSSQRKAGETVNSIYILFDPVTGAPLACLDGETLTKKRTATISALAASMMAREDAHRLLMVGTGSMAVDMVRAHAALRPLSAIAIWGRNGEAAQARAAQLRALGLPAEPVADLETAVGKADIICCATTARTPVVKGAWLREGQHVDLVGGFRPDMREVDDEAIRISRVVADTRAGVLAEAGDLIQPIAAGIVTPAHIVSDLAGLCTGQGRGRMADGDITLFKSVGTGVADLSAARLAFYRHGTMNAKTPQQ